MILAVTPGTPLIKYVAPLYLLTAIGLFCVRDLPGWIGGLATNPVATLTLAMLGAVLVLLLIVTAIGSRRWRRLGLDLDGTRPPDDELEAQDLRRRS